MNDESVQATNDDASECKRCAVSLGYYKDNYISMFIRPTTRRAPEINRGYFARVKAIDLLVEQFVKCAGADAQIINLGCGFDTFYWRTKDNGMQMRNYVEVDFPAVTSRKCYIIKRHRQLLEKIHDPEDGEVKFSPTDLHAGNYHLLGADLRNVHELEVKLSQSEVDYTRPTLFLSECVLVYIDVKSTENLLSYLGKKFPCSFMINYEMVNLNDVFSNVMLENLRARGCTLTGAEACSSLQSQKERFIKAGWMDARAWGMVDVYDAIPACERQRIEKIEFLDERELLMQLFQHYCICVAWTNPRFAHIDIT